MKRLFGPKRQESERTQAFIKKIQDFVLKSMIKINEDVSANDQLEFVE
jgi:hypothetical protein